MDERFLLLAVLLPLFGGGLLPLTHRKGPKVMYGMVYAITMATSILTWVLILTCRTESFTAVRLTKELTLTLRFDGLGRFFAGIVATLWPLTILYASEYMKHEERQTAFFTFFTMTYGVTLGVAMAANLFTMYVFYELLTLATVPLVMHPMTRRAVRAAKTYFSFSLGGAALAFTSIMYLIGNGYGGDFRFGGFLEGGYSGSENLMLAFYALGFLGFGVKAALFPLHVWLPKASVAPTPVTALLHAVAVVKSGVFAVIRLTFFAYGTGVLAGTWAQGCMMGLAIFTIFFGATKAVKEQHWKRRLAYSTVANLSYILFGVTMMTQAGLAAGLLHMAFHAEIKILAFFCAGAVLHGTGREYLSQLNGLGRKMPITFGCFTVAALALTGIPPFSGFVSKWQLLTAAADSQNGLAYLGAGVLLFGALLTAIYMLTVVCRAFFPCAGSEDGKLAAEHEVNWRMTVPMTILAAAIVLTGLFAKPIVGAALAIAGGLR
ncbi:MAG: complex I subunit 5 family protein [Faecousia sp.]